MKMEQTINKNPYYPPGGILIWLIIILEMFTFLGAIIAFKLNQNSSPDIFAESRQLLNPLVGTINTIVLITSGLFMAYTVGAIKKNKVQKSQRYILITLILGLVFLTIKGFEFYQKIELGIGLDYSTFFTFYWLLTGFHFIHVLFGVGLLVYMFFALKRGAYSSKNSLDIETTASYWHMCDLIWILIFPVLYLIH